MIKSIVIISALTVLLCGCAIKYNVVGELSTGEPLTGSAVTQLSGPGLIEVSAIGVSCTGKYNGYALTREMTIPLRCDEGSTGVANVSFDPGFTSGTGTFRMSEGTTGSFAFGA